MLTSSAEIGLALERSLMMLSVSAALADSPSKNCASAFNKYVAKYVSILFGKIYHYYLFFGFKESRIHTYLLHIFS